MPLAVDPVSDGALPPFLEPEGPLLDDESVVRAFARGEVALGHSALFHVEGPTLVGNRDIAVAVLVGPGSVILRTDLPDGMAGHRATVERVLAEEGLTLLDEETLLAPAVAIQVLGIRLSNWDLWGTDIDRAFAALREAASGDQFESFFPGDDPPGSSGD